MTSKDKAAADKILLISYLTMYVDQLEHDFPKMMRRWESGDRSSAEVQRLMGKFFTYAALRQLIELNFALPCVTSKLHAREISSLDGLLNTLKLATVQQSMVSPQLAAEYKALYSIVKKYFDLTPQTLADDLDHSAYATYYAGNKFYPKSFTNREDVARTAADYADELSRYKVEVALGRAPNARKKTSTKTRARKTKSTRK